MRPKKTKEIGGKKDNISKITWGVTPKEPWQ